MKKYSSLLLILLTIFSCESEHKLTFEPLKFQGEACKNCPEISINLPQALDDSGVATAINRSLREEVIALLSFSENEDIETMDQAMASFTESYKELKTKFPDEIAWEAKIDGEVIYEDANLVTIAVNSYTFTGGAHGYGSTSYLNFDKVQGTELENWELFDDPEGFETYAESKFKAQEDIPQEANINATGFMFEGDSFHLSNNVGYTQDGVQLIYNQYEVASYADGPIVLTLPYSEINLFLKHKVKS